jgi:hypothetical protein
MQASASAYFEHHRANARTIRVLRDPHIVQTLNVIRNNVCRNERAIIMRADIERHLKDTRARGDAVGNAPIHIGDIFKTPILDDVRQDQAELVGQQCLPDEEPPSADLVCQLTDEWAWVYIPGRFVNARKGDVVLSPGGNGPIGGVLRQVSPPQMYAHCGIMIQNYYRIRHSTASVDWLRGALVDSFTSRGSDGLEPDKLKYIWPGTIDQTTEEAIHGSLLEDPDRLLDSHGEIKKYRITAFDAKSKLNANGEIVDPMVVMPDPLIEAERPWVRDVLHQVAEAAKQIRGHYRLYCYTEARGSLGISPEFDAPDRGPGWWASGTRATVCSSFICAAVHSLKEPAVRLEGQDLFTTPADLEPTDTAQGAEVDFRTLDGLYFYSEQERRDAGNWLYRYYYDLAYAEAGPFGTLFTDAPDDTANQICNTFAFDWSGEDSAGDHAKDSDRWKNPGVGRAVSPSDIMDYWDAPRSLDNNIAHGLYGFSTKLIYREPYLEWRRISRWVKAETDGQLAGTVIYRGSPVAGAVVKAAGKDVVTGGDGHFLLKVPAGPYRVEAGKLMDGWFVEGAVDATVTAGTKTEITIILNEPSEWYREITIRGTMDIKDWEDIGDEFATRTFFQNGIQIGPFDTHAETSWIERMGGEIRVEVYLKLDWKLDSSVDVWYNVILFEGASESTTDPDGRRTGTVNVVKDTTFDLHIFVRNDDEDDDDHADISLLISNDRRP